MRRKVFIFFSGPYRNVGDSLIRRRALEWARDMGAAHVLLGGAYSPDWTESLSTVASDTLYRGPASWLREAVQRPGHAPVLLIEPGEFNTDRRFLKSLVLLYFVSLVFRLRGGTIVQAPRSIANASPFWSAIYRATLGRGPVALWREQPSWNAFRQAGAVVPDLGFDDPDSIPSAAADSPSSHRPYLVISLRVDRPTLPPQLLGWLKEYATSRGLQLLPVSQVEEDDRRTNTIAEQLDAIPALWGRRTSVEQEAALRAVYGKARLVISDRLHVLVLATLHGASPLELVPSPNGKIAKHFDVIGLQDISFDSTGLASREAFDELLDASAARGTEVAAAVSAARERLHRVRADISPHDEALGARR